MRETTPEVMLSQQTLLTEFVRVHGGANAKQEAVCRAFSVSAADMVLATRRGRVSSRS